MKRTFVIAAMLCLLVANEVTAEFFLAIFVGNMTFADAFALSFGSVHLDSFIKSSAVRAIPFTIFVISLFYLKTRSKADRGFLWIMLGLISTFLFSAYWGMQHAFFTDARASSTGALVLFFAPFWTGVFYAVAFLLYSAIIHAIRADLPQSSKNKNHENN